MRGQLTNEWGKFLILKAKRGQKPFQQMNRGFAMLALIRTIAARPSAATPAASGFAIADTPRFDAIFMSPDRKSDQEVLASVLAQL